MRMSGGGCCLKGRREKRECGEPARATFCETRRGGAWGGREGGLGLFVSYVKETRGGSDSLRPKWFEGS